MCLLVCRQPPARPGGCSRAEHNLERRIFMHDLKVVFVIEFVGRKDAVILTLRSVLPLRRLQHRINVDDTLPRLR